MRRIKKCKLTYITELTYLTQKKPQQNQKTSNTPEAFVKVLWEW